jgi:hypothetical protein
MLCVTESDMADKIIELNFGCDRVIVFPAWVSWK